MRLQQRKHGQEPTSDAACPHVPEAVALTPQDSVTSGPLLSSQQPTDLEEHHSPRAARPPDRSSEEPYPRKQAKPRPTAASESLPGTAKICVVHVTSRSLDSRDSPPLALLPERATRRARTTPAVPALETPGHLPVLPLRDLPDQPRNPRPPIACCITRSLMGPARLNALRPAFLTAAIARPSAPKSRCKESRAPIMTRASIWRRYEEGGGGG